MNDAGGREDEINVIISLNVVLLNLALQMQYTLRHEIQEICSVCHCGLQEWRKENSVELTDPRREKDAFVVLGFLDIR